MRKALLLLFFLPQLLSSQIVTENKQPAEFYIKNVLMGAGVVVGNIQHVGMIGGLGQFKADSVIIGVKSGIVLSSGNADSIQGPNDASNFTSFGKLPPGKKEKRNVVRGDKDLNKLCRGVARDMTMIEFDFVPVNNVLEFNYVFASDEYPEYVGSKYNDAFGFFLSGPGIKGKQNLAVLPDGKTPVTINSINAHDNENYFRKNYGTLRKLSAAEKKKRLKEKEEMLKHQKSFLINTLQFDGLTTVLKVHADVIPYQRYHLKIAVCDAHDMIYDSAVFIEAGSFVSVADTSGKYAEIAEEFKKVPPPNTDSILKGLKKSKVPELIIASVPEKLELTTIYFASDKAVVPDSTFPELDELAAWLVKNDSVNCFLLGYTDNSGSESYNLKLSKRRAEAAKEYLVKKGVKPGRISIEELGIKDPEGDNSTPAGKALNRRVEIILE